MTKLVLKFDKSIEFNDKHSLNIDDISVTLEVINFVKVKLSKLEQPKNNSLILNTDEVSKLLKLIDFNEEQYENIEFILINSFESKWDKSIDSIR